MKISQITAVAVAGLLSVSIATPLLAQDMLSGADAIAKRQELMKLNGATLKAAGAASGDAAITAAQTLIANFTNLGTLWPADSKDGDTKALPGIWNSDGTHSDGFLVAFSNALGGANVLLAAAQAGDTATYGAAVKALGGSCGACHDTYRAR